jgi:hypothetical protein
MSTVTIITPTTGKASLEDLIASIKTQSVSVDHIVLWDKFRDGPITPNILLKYATNTYSVNNIVMNDNFINGKAKGSSLRAIGLMAANTEFVTFGDDDVIWEQNHLESMLSTLGDKNWVFCKRIIWAKLPNGDFEYLGIDDFESVGEEAKTPYKMVDNNCMMFRRKYGVSASPLYREETEYCDDRNFYQFLMKYAGDPVKTLLPTINQVCPNRLIEFFRNGCTR